MPLNRRSAAIAFAMVLSSCDGSSGSLNIAGTNPSPNQPTEAQKLAIKSDFASGMQVETGGFDQSEALELRGLMLGYLDAPSGSREERDLWEKYSKMDEERLARIKIGAEEAMEKHRQSELIEAPRRRFAGMNASCRSFYEGVSNIVPGEILIERSSELSTSIDELLSAGSEVDPLFYRCAEDMKKMGDERIAIENQPTTEAY